MVILPHSSGSKWCCDSTKSAAAMSSFLQVPLYFPQSWNDLLSRAPSSPFSLAQMRASLFSHDSYGAIAWCSSSLVLWFFLHTGRLSSVRLIFSVYDYSLFKCKCTEDNGKWRNEAYISIYAFMFPILISSLQSYLRDWMDFWCVFIETSSASLKCEIFLSFIFQSSLCQNNAAKP